MKAKLAFTIVLDLAQENVLEEYAALQDEEILVPERRMQLQACEKVAEILKAMITSGMID